MRSRRNILGMLVLAVAAAGAAIVLAGAPITFGPVAGEITDQ